MKTVVSLLIITGFAHLARSQGASDAPAELSFQCPEKNGFFADPEQCDLYYECVDNVATANLCPDGLMFNDKTTIDAKCDYPFNIDCGTREFVQQPETGIDPRCHRGNGFFNHEDADECNKFYNCVNGVAYELPCATTLIFDEAEGTCVRPEQASPYAKVCKPKEKQSIAGFTCPEEKVLGPHGQPLAHPSFPHPESCQNYIACYNSKEIRELGCMKGQVYDYVSYKCVDPQDGPQDCKCWYECDEETSKGCMPDGCLSDCSCPAKSSLDSKSVNVDS